MAAFTSNTQSSGLPLTLIRLLYGMVEAVLIKQFSSEVMGTLSLEKTCDMHAASCCIVFAFCGTTQLGGLWRRR